MNSCKDIGIDGRIILKYVLKEYGVNVWAGSSDDSEERRALANTVMKLRFPLKAKNYITC
jgi:hypothetical protein